MATSSPVKFSNKPAPPPKPKPASSLASPTANVSRGGTSGSGDGVATKSSLHTTSLPGVQTSNDKWRRSVSDHSPTSSASESTSKSYELKQSPSQVLHKSPTGLGCKQVRPEQHHPSPKPALLPKPQLTPPSSANIKSNIQSSKLQVSAPDVVLSTEQHSKEESLRFLQASPSSGFSLQSSSVKAPVAKLEAFENSPDKAKPVRPPRSPKNKVFPQGPFSNSSEKPAIPAKKKSLLALQNFKCESEKFKQQVKLDIPNVIERKSKSTSLGRFEVPTLGVKVKSASLGRNIEPPPLESPELESHYWDIASVSKSVSVPVRPPRKSRRKFDSNSDLLLGHTLCRSISLFSSIEEAEKNIPIYAVVNYNLKKNRRQATKSVSVLDTQKVSEVEFNYDIDASTSEDNFFKKFNNSININSDLESNSDNKFTIANHKSSSPLEINNSVAKPNDFIPIESSNEQESKKSVNPGVRLVILQDKISDIDKRKVDNVMGNSEYSVPVTSQSSKLTQSTQSELTQATQSESTQSTQSESTLETDKKTENTSNQSEENKVSVKKSEVVHVSAKCTTSSQTEIESLSKSFEISVEAHVSVTHSDVNSDDKQNQYEICQVLIEKLSDKDKWSSAEAIEDSCASSKLEYLSAKASIHSSLSDILPDELECEVHEAVVTSVEGSRENQISKSSQEIHEVSNSSTIEAKEENHKTETNGSAIISDTMSHDKERAKSMPHLGGKNTNSSDKHSIGSVFGRRRKMRGTTPWCDEGELSTGVLGDLDSSDAARQSSVDDVGTSDTEDATPVRRNKLSSLTQFTKNIIRKSTRKSKESKKEVIQSQFYCNKPSNSSEPDDIEGHTGDDYVTAMANSETLSVGSASLSHTQCEDDDEQACSLETASRTGHSSSIISHSDSENEADFYDSFPDSSSDPYLTEEQKRAKKAYQTAEEIMTSERVFVNVLKLLCVDFRSFVKASSRDSKTPVIPESELGEILRHLPEILSFSELLLHDLEQRILEWSNLEKISDVIVEKGPFLKLYTQYMQKYLHQCKLLEESCKKYPVFAKVVQDFQASPRCKKLKLEHCMLKPVQRVPQYRLLLEQYIKCLEPGSPDLKDTQKALEIVCEVADHANRTLKEGDALSKLLKLQALLGHHEIIKPGRMLIREGELLKLCRKGMQPRYFILLNDCLLYTTYYGSGLSSGLKVNYEIPLQQMKVNIPSAEDYRNEFSIINRTKSFTLAASSPEEMQHWVDDLYAAIQEKATKQSTFLHAKISPFQNDSSTFKLGREAPIWIPDDRVTMCQICTAEFTVTFRRHHCRACGKVVCGDCSAHKAPLPYMKFQAARICNDCFNILLKEFEDSAFSLPEDLSVEERNEILESAKFHFKKATPAINKKSKKYIPQRLKEVCANDAGCQMGGWLQRFQRRSWKKMWFVLKDQVLYVYKASEDVVALESIPVLGYQVEFAEKHFQLYEGIDAKLVFMLTHKGQPQLVFHAENHHSAQRWIQAMQEQTVLPM